MKRVFEWIGRIIIAIMLTAIFWFAWIVYSFDKVLEPIESVGKYEEVLADWKATELVNHFPGFVPANASNVRFSSFPGFLQGGGHVQLRMELPEAVVKACYDHATKSAKQHHDGGNCTTLVNKQDDGLWSTNPNTFGKGTYEFPSDYRIFVFDAKSSDNGPRNGWNHGKSKGMVISLKRNEVLYYAERW